MKDDYWPAQRESLWVEMMDTSLEEYLVEWMVLMLDVITAVLMVEMLGSKMVE